MPRFHHPDDLPQRHPTEMHAFVNTLGAVPDDEEYRAAFIAAHLSDPRRSAPSVIASLWTSDADALRDLGIDPDLATERLEWTVSLSPDQARALGWALLRLADGLETMAETGEIDPEELAAQDAPVYWSEPSL